MSFVRLEFRNKREDKKGGRREGVSKINHSLVHGYAFTRCLSFFRDKITFSSVFFLRIYKYSRLNFTVYM